MEISREQMNARRPEKDEYGNAVLERMNRSHNQLYLWGIGHTDYFARKKILDIGCGGGKNIYNLSELTDAELVGLDASEASVQKTLEINSEKVEKGRVSAFVGVAEALPFANETFDFVTAFETVYYWKNIEDCFRGIYAAISPGGEFLVCNEDKDTSRIYEVAEALEMTLYTASDLKKLLEASGFCNVRTFEHENGRWVCAVGEKPKTRCL